MTPVPIHAFNPGPMTGDGNWTWLLPGRTPTLIDAGTGDPRHLDAVEAALAGASLAQVLVTHAHVDHASGAVAIAQRFQGVRFLKMPWAERDGRWPVSWQPIGGDDIVDAGDTRLRAVHTPGHAPDHLCFWHEESRTMFSGDLAVKGTTVYIPPNLRGDLADYLASLERVRALKPARLLPAHGPVIDDPEGLLSNYLQHRHEREEQILAALHAGPATPEALVPLIYRGLRENLMQVARETVLAHLLKLEREGRALRRDESWHIMEP
ncbi:MAG TPA: MBL fold metallo-hydrolase [Vicinamibacterales bacterium]|nr:MBL fold metallo-hydrolase [Vicinamibacterales bacterium]